MNETLQPPPYVLVCGSLYLVGSALSSVGWKEEEAPGKLVIH
jgi:folylpolyglutamate synthase/dihydropteroate synthase